MSVQAILISRGVAKEITLPGVKDLDHLQGMYDALGCDCFCSAGRTKQGDAVYVDDNGLLTVTEDTWFHLVDWYPQPLAGNILIQGLDVTNGDTLPTTKSTVEDMQAAIQVSGKAKYFRGD